MNTGIVSLEAARHAGSRFRAMFKGAFTRWETCGWVRRREPEGVRSLRHVAVPAESPDGTWDNAMWAQIYGHVTAMSLYLDTAFNEQLDPEARICSLIDPKGWRHVIVLASDQSWPVRLTQETGPPDYWAMLHWRLRLAESLTIRFGVVCTIDRSGINEQAQPIADVDERMLFRLARTAYRPPHERFRRPSSSDWPAGMLPEWYPPGVRIYASPSPGRPGFDSSRPYRRRHRP